MCKIIVFCFFCDKENILFGYKLLVLFFDVGLFDVSKDWCLWVFFFLLSECDVMFKLKVESKFILRLYKIVDVRRKMWGLWVCLCKWC